MSAEVLREAAALMREEHALRDDSTECRCDGETSDWFDRSICPEPCGSMHYVCNECLGIKGRCSVASRGVVNGNRLAAAWLAVADLLDAAAGRAESKVARGGLSSAVWSHEIRALAVARAYLGADQ
jgi:hypothetical protein